jgi:hypothetical protein
VEIIAETFRIPRRPSMVSAFAEAKPHTYRVVQSKRDKSTWLYALDVPNQAAFVYCDTHDPKSEGFGGSTLTFTLEDGTTYSAKGPWHSGASALYTHTGVDLRDKHLTRVFVAEDMKYENGNYYSPVLYNVYYADESPVLGRFDRYLDILDRLFRETGLSQLFCHNESEGGSSSGLYTPDRVTEQLAALAQESKYTSLLSAEQHAIVVA